MKLLKFKTIKSPVGNLKLVVNDHALLAILWENDKPNRVKLENMVEAKNDGLLLETEKQLNEYFQNKRTHFDLPIEFQGTEFQKNVWNLLNEIPYGVTCSYKDIAIKLNNPKGVRAVGGAVGRNPISIIVPCHRVVGANGTLTGFAGGLPRKQILLDIEKD